MVMQKYEIYIYSRNVLGKYKIRIGPAFQFPANPPKSRRLTSKCYQKLIFRYFDLVTEFRFA